VTAPLRLWAVVLVLACGGCNPPYNRPFDAATNIRLFHECLRAANAGNSEEADEVVERCRWNAREQAQDLYEQAHEADSDAK
jgi:hypothetical protein